MFSNVTLARRPWWLAGLLWALTVAGCGSGLSATPADATRAEQVLHEALDAWKAGATQADLAGRADPIQVTDLDWKNGFRLVRYQSAGEGRLVGFDMSYPVVLELKSPKGKTVKRKAIYVVSTAAVPLILRQEG